MEILPFILIALGELFMVIGALTLMTGTIRITCPTEICKECRYDLRGLSDDSARCPECGAELAACRALVEQHGIDWPKLVLGLLLFLLATCVVPALLFYLAG